jgi:hypothetical protein
MKSIINAVISADDYNIIIEEYAHEFDCFFETKESDFVVGSTANITSSSKLRKFPSKKIEILAYFKSPIITGDPHRQTAESRVGDQKVFSIYEKALDHFQLEMRNIAAYKFTMPWTRIYIQLKST